MRRYAGAGGDRFPSELTKVFNSLERNSNPFGFRARTRADWAKGLGAEDLGEHPDEPVDVLYWVGCYGSFDERNQKVAQSLARDPEERRDQLRHPRHGGELHRRSRAPHRQRIPLPGAGAGQRRDAARLRRKKIVTACPHCMNTIKNEYPQFGGDFEVVHHSQFIADLMKSGQIKLDEGMDKKSITFHDPCYLGRYNDVYDAPREVVSGLGVEVTEMRRSRNKSLCCGGGGGRAFMEERIGKKMSHNRLGDVLETGCGTLAAGCPFCITMFEDAIGSTGNAEKVHVEDIAELVAARLQQRTEDCREVGPFLRLSRHLAVGRKTWGIGTRQTMRSRCVPAWRARTPGAPTADTRRSVSGASTCARSTTCRGPVATSRMVRQLHPRHDSWHSSHATAYYRQRMGLPHHTRSPAGATVRNAAGRAPPAPVEANVEGRRVGL